MLTIVVTSVVLSQAVFYAESVYLHRALAHRSIRLHPLAAGFFRMIVWLFLGSQPREWVAVHRLHHRFADTPRDPHSPLYRGFWRVALRSSSLFRDVCRDRELVARTASDVPLDRLAKLPIGRRYGGITVALGASTAVFGPAGAVLLYGLVLGQVIIGTAVINGLTHLKGAQPHPVPGTNLRLLAPFFAGEPLHNNHHAAPRSPNFAERGTELDPGWWLVRSVLSPLGLAAPLSAVQYE